MKIEQKLQIDVIKGERIYYKIFDDIVLLIDGYVGVYLKASELKVDLSKLIEIKENSEKLNPKIMDSVCKKAKETKTACLIPGRLAIKIKSENDYCFVQEKYLKMFYGRTGVKIQGKKEPMLVLKYGVPYGVILPINITEELE